MPVSVKPAQRGENRLLSVLPQAEYERLLLSSEQIHLKKSTVLYRAGDEVRYCYFPSGGAMMSLLSATEAGETLEVSMVGSEGMLGIPTILQTGVTPFEATVQVEGDAMRIKADILNEEFNRAATLRSLLLRYTNALFYQICQSAVCHHFHTIEQRLCRWLLMRLDRIQSNAFALTQEFIAQMLGAPRTSVTATAAALERAGMIKHTRGQIVIVDRTGLENLACECYRVIKKESESFYQSLLK